MKAFAHTYTYFIGSLFLLALFAVAYWWCRSHRRQILCGGLLSAPSGFCALLFVPEYWQPQQLFRFGAGPEDLIFSFANGGLAWLIVVAVFDRQSLEARLALVPILRRWLVITAGFLLLWIPIRTTELGVMESSILAALSILAVLLRRRPGGMRLAVTGAVLFAVPYLLLTALLFRLFPSFLGQWNLTHLSGWLVLGVPFEELAWALSWGATWPVVLAYLFDLPAEAVERDPVAQRTAHELGTA